MSTYKKIIDLNTLLKNNEYFKNKRVSLAKRIDVIEKAIKKEQAKATINNKKIKRYETALSSMYKWNEIYQLEELKYKYLMNQFKKNQNING